MTPIEILMAAGGWLSLLILVYALVHFITSHAQRDPQCWWCDGTGQDENECRCECCGGTGDNPLLSALGAKPKRRQSLRERGDI